FDTNEPFEVPAGGGLVPVPEEAGGLEEIPSDAAAGAEEAAGEATGGLVEIPAPAAEESPGDQTP
ncbi:MAG: hypothetical protein KDD20_04315, partial [Mangrovimonas sp.]|nr:hypothetical protein [Mangrovimonas sp.]